MTKPSAPLLLLARENVEQMQLINLTMGQTLGKDNYFKDGGLIVTNVSALKTLLPELKSLGQPYVFIKAEWPLKAKMAMHEGKIVVMVFEDGKDYELWADQGQALCHFIAGLVNDQSDSRFTVMLQNCIRSLPTGFGVMAAQYRSVVDVIMISPHNLYDVEVDNFMHHDNSDLNGYMAILANSNIYVTNTRDFVADLEGRTFNAGRTRIQPIFS